MFTTIGLRKLTTPGRYSDGARTGLWLQVRGPENRSWIFRYTLDGKSHEMGLGHVNEVSLAEAREIAAAARRLVWQGIDPIKHRREAKKEKRAALAQAAFKQTAALFIAAQAPGWRNAKHAAQWSATLEEYAFPVFGDRAVNAILTGDVLAALNPIWTAKPETASRVRGRIEAVLDYAKARGWRDGENPAQWKGHLSRDSRPGQRKGPHLHRRTARIAAPFVGRPTGVCLANLLPSRAKLAAVQHHAALAWQDVPGSMAELRGQAGIAALALQSTILTATRTGENIGATWAELDLAAAVWTVPPGRMKGGREHRVPLSAPALALLRELAAVGTDVAGFVFPGGKIGAGLSGMAMTALLRRMGRGDITVHGFRSTFRDWAGEATEFPRDLAEAALAHSLTDKVEAAYRRGDALEKRRAMMEAWAAWCGSTPPA